MKILRLALTIGIALVYLFGFIFPNRHPSFRRQKISVYEAGRAVATLEPQLLTAAAFWIFIDKLIAGQEAGRFLLDGRSA